MFFFCGSCLLCFFQKKKKSKPSKTQIKTLPKQDNKDFSPVFSVRNFTILKFYIWSMTHFELTYGFIIYLGHTDVQFFCSIVEKLCFLHWIDLYFSQKSVNYDVGFIQSSLLEVFIKFLSSWVWKFCHKWVLNFFKCFYLHLWTGKLFTLCSLKC